MALNLGSLTGSTLEAMSTYLSNNAKSIAAEGQAFIDGLKASATQNFQIGDIPSLEDKNLNFDQELDRASRTFVVGPVLDLNDIDSKLTQLTALATPDAPVLAIPSVNVPDFEASRPVVVMPDRPTNDVGTAPTDAPSIQDVQPPEAPVVTLPNVPTFEELQIPAAPSFTIPTFLATAPQNLLVAPSNTFSYVDPGYISELNDPLVQKLLSDLMNGGYGIEPADEQALWARARDRAEQQARIEVEAAQRDASNTSFPMPQGAYFSALDRAREKLQQTLSDINREIALKRSDMYVENRKFTIQEVQKYEQMMIGLYNAVQERAFNFAKETVNLAIAVFDASVRNFSTQLESYKTESVVFEARIRAELSKAELFKAQIEAEKLRGEFNQTKVNLYNAQLQGVQQVVNLFKSRVEAANLLAQLQQQKLEAFRTRVSVFSERVRAKQAEYDMYRAGIQGELAKVDVYKTDVEAYTKRVDAEETKARITLQGNEALLQQFKASVARYEAQLEGFSKVVDGTLAKARTQIQGYNVDVEAYKAFVTTLQEGARVRVLNQQMNNQRDIASLGSRVEQVKFRLEQLRLTVANMNEINFKGAEYFRTALGSTLASLNGLSVKSESA